jgi:hypothetical protein
LFSLSRVNSPTIEWLGAGAMARPTIDTTQLANLERAQWAYKYGPSCGIGFTYGLKGGYLYFDNGRPVAIQR